MYVRLCLVPKSPAHSLFHLSSDIVCFYDRYIFIHFNMNVYDKYMSVLAGSQMMERFYARNIHDQLPYTLFNFRRQRFGSVDF